MTERYVEYLYWTYCTTVLTSQIYDHEALITMIHEMMDIEAGHGVEAGDSIMIHDVS